MQYIVSFLIIIFLIFFVLASGKIINPIRVISTEMPSKFLDITAGLTALSVVLIFDNYILVLTASGIIGVLSLLAGHYKLYQRLNTNQRKSRGVLLFPLVFTLLYAVLFPENVFTVVVTLLIFTFSDSAAVISGNLFPHSTYLPEGNQKTFSGLIVFSGVTFLIIFVSPQIAGFLLSKIYDFNIMYMLQASASITIILMITKILSPEGYDNITVTVIASVLIYIFIGLNDSVLLNNVSLGIVLGCMIAVLSFKFRFLNASGSFATVLLAIFIYGFGGWQWTLPILLFFLLSSVLSKIRSVKNSEVDKQFEKTGVRDYLQVFSNGGIGGVLVVINYFYVSDIPFFIYAAIVATVCADTWGTEIGTMYNAKTYNILTLKKVKQGSSGGISIPGTLGGAAGALLIAFTSVLWISYDNIAYFLMIFFSGIIGSLIDSFLGAAVQGIYECRNCGAITEKKVHCSVPSILKKGFPWLNNDLVNISAAIGGGVFSIILFYIIS